MYWVYDLPNWLFGTLTVLAFCVFGLVGLLATRRWVPALHHGAESFNDIVGFYLGAVTVLYGIALGLLMVDVWATFTDTAGKVDAEAGTVASLYRDISCLPEPEQSELQNEMAIYTRQIIEIGWPQQQKGIVPSANMIVLDDMGRILATFEPKTEGQRILVAEAFRQYNALVQRRRARLLSVTAGLPSSLWALVFVGAVINIAVTWCFHVQNKKMHLWMTGLMSSLLGLMIFLLAAMDHPYRGRVSISSEAFETVYNQLMK